MNNENFAYWLQGLFELSDVNCLSKQQVECISNHIKVVEKTETLTGFTAWLSGFIDASDTLDKTKTAKVSKKLSDEFKHVIDPANGVTKELLETHNPKRGLGDLEIMC